MLRCVKVVWIIPPQIFLNSTCSIILAMVEIIRSAIGRVLVISRDYSHPGPRGRYFISAYAISRVPRHEVNVVSYGHTD
jgi:hypothetical protein